MMLTNIIADPKCLFDQISRQQKCRLSP